MKIRATIQMLALFLAGCASGNGSYPSLAKRAVESRGNEASGAPSAKASPADPVLEQEVGGLLDKARSGAAAFDAHVAPAEQQVEAARGSAVSSEAWVTAQLALSTLESERYDSVFALASLDTLYINRLNAIAAGDAQGGMELVHEARAGALGIVDRQNDILDELREKLTTP